MTSQDDMKTNFSITAPANHRHGTTDHAGAMVEFNHRHDWFAQRAYVETLITRCQCGATRKWNGKRWVTRPDNG